MHCNGNTNLYSKRNLIRKNERIIFVIEYNLFKTKKQYMSKSILKWLDLGIDVKVDI